MWLKQYHALMDRFLNFADHYLNEEIRSNPFKLRKSRVLIGSPVVGFVLLLEFIYRYNWGEGIPTLWILAGIMTTFFLCPFVLVHTQSEKKASFFLSISILLLVSLAIWIDGGLDAPPARAAPAFILLFSFLLPTRQSFLLIGLFFLNLIAVYVAHTIGFIYTPPYLDITENLILKIIINAMVFALVRLYDSSRKDTERHLIQIARYKSNFLSNMSHDIRTPLNAILGLSSILEEKYGSNKSSKQAFKTISQAGEHLLYLVNNILDYSYFQSEGLILNPGKAKISVLFEEIKNLTQKKSEETGVPLHLEIDKKLSKVHRFDSDRLKQALLNMVTNAFKYTRKGQITLRADLRKQVDNKEQVAFCVDDTGIGIPRKKFSSLFSSFEQAHESISTKKGGVGLGLMITKTIVEAMGGTIEVVSEVDVGTKFFFIIELESSKEEASEKKKKTKVDTASIPETKILVAEDVDTNLLLLSYYIKKTDITITPAENGKVALKKFKEEKFDLIFMDIQMPIMDGYTATRKIRSYEKSYNLDPTPIIGLSAFSSLEEVEKAKEAGCNNYLTKPINKYDFLKMIKDIMNKKTNKKITKKS